MGYNFKHRVVRVSKYHFQMAEEDPDSSVARARHRQKRGLLKLYYGVGDEPGETQLILVMSTELTLDLMRTWKNY